MFKMNPISCRINNARGSLLIESLVAIMILSVSLTIIVQSLLGSFRAMALNASYSTAGLMLDSQMELLLAKDFLEGHLSSGADVFSDPDQRFRYTEEEKKIIQDKTTGTLKEVKLSINWQNGRKTNTLSVTTNLFDVPQSE